MDKIVELDQGLLKLGSAQIDVSGYYHAMLGRYSDKDVKMRRVGRIHSQLYEDKPKN